jgi:hypothetical protein
MPAQRVARRTGFAPGIVNAYGAFLHPEFAKQAANAEQHSARIIAGDLRNAPDSPASAA